jgi:biopolymer transport protein ExbB
MKIEPKALPARAWAAIVLALCAALIVGISSRTAIAQAEKAAGGAAGERAKADGEHAKAPVPKVEANRDAPDEERGAASRPATLSAATPGEGRLAWVIRCSGFIGLVLLLLSIYFVSTVGRLFWEMRVEMAAPPEIVQQCENLLEQRDFKGIYALVKEDDSFFSRVLTTGIAELPNGLTEARDSMERVGDAITAEMEKKISMLAVLGTLGPMIGLLGTLKGMITSFGGLGSVGGAGMDTGAIATGISGALLLTFEGVALSVPAIYFFALFRNRVISISSSVMFATDQFLRHFSHAGRARAAATAPEPRPAR